jgi:hypothetical protein
MRKLRNISLAMLVVTVIFVKSTATEATDILCTPVPGELDPVCSCQCTSPDSCGGNQNDCTIGGCHGMACFYCFGGNPTDYSPEILECNNHDALFCCWPRQGGG